MAFQGGAALAADALRFGPAPAWVQTGIDPVPAKSEGGALSIRLLDSQARFDAEGAHAFGRRVVKINAPEGLQLAGNIVESWQPATDTITVNAVATTDQRNPVLAGHVENAAVLAGGTRIGRLHISQRWPVGTPMRWRVGDALPEAKIATHAGERELLIDATDVRKGYAQVDQYFADMDLVVESAPAAIDPPAIAGVLSSRAPRPDRAVIGRAPRGRCDRG